MHYGICLLSVVPARKEPSGASEMVTQLLFGDHYTVLETTDNWLKISIAYDGYACWISARQHARLSAATFNYLQKYEAPLCRNFIHPITNKLEQITFPVTMGAVLPFLHNETCSFDAWVFGFDGKSQNMQKQSAEDILNTAAMFLNAPYLWGGKSPLGIDCSGFTQLVYKLNGYKLPRDANQQVELGAPLSFVEEAQAGDLAFFDNEEGRIVHVGILLDSERIIHASGCVKIERFDHYGIYNNDIKKYSHTLRVIKRILD